MPKYNCTVDLIFPAAPSSGQVCDRRKLRGTKPPQKEGALFMSKQLNFIIIAPNTLVLDTNLVFVTLDYDDMTGIK